MARVDIYKDKVRFVLRDPGGLVYPYIEKKTKQVTRLAKAQVGVATGALKNSIEYNMRSGAGPVSSRVTAHDRKAIMHHEGTKPHIIEGKSKTLKFRGGPTVLYRKRVMHPGTKPNRFLTDSLQAVF